MTSQHAVIVGGSSGIGLATARELLARGFKTTIAGRDAKRLETASKALGGKAVAINADAADADSVQDLFSRAGKFDHLVLALGSTKGVGPFATVKLSDVREGFEEKTLPQFACAQSAIPFLSTNGSITFVSGLSAQAAMPGTAGIGAANAAIAALVPILAAELRPLRVNGVSPGVIDTPWWDFLSKEQKAATFAEYAAKTPVGRVGEPEDVARAIAFLIAETFITGHTLTCDGGLLLAA
jgi:NAD(P)-dependent dehydrogenase (short-subunit alcohol dehydrogenase family)